MTILDEVKASRRKAKAALEALSLRMTVSTASEARSLQPRFDAGVAELQTFDAWLAANKDRIPLSHAELEDE